MDTKLKNCNYILITPARNEETHIEKTILSVLSQTILPKKWIIVSDGSTDYTNEIVNKYLAENWWMKLIRMPEHRNRQFAAKVNCFNAGYNYIRNAEYDIIGNLDADISFDENYFEFLLQKFAQMPNLGVAGTPFIENGYSSVNDSFEGEKHVAGGCQLFRRECFEQVGGYIPIREGGIDWVAVTTARMMSWETISFKEKHFFHHRKLGTGNGNKIRANFNYGKKDWFLGGHPLWEIFRISYQLTKKPYIIGGLAIFSGYLCAAISKKERSVSVELMKFHQREQKQKLSSILKTVLRFQRFKKYRIEP